MWSYINLNSLRTLSASALEVLPPVFTAEEPRMRKLRRAGNQATDENVDTSRGACCNETTQD